MTTTTDPRARAALAAALDAAAVLERLLTSGLPVADLAYWLEPLGLGDVADEAGVPRPTVDKWRQRGVMPREVWVVAGGPAWPRAAVVLWLVLSGRRWQPSTPVAVRRDRLAALGPVLDALDGELGALRSALEEAGR